MARHRPHLHALGQVSVIDVGRDENFLLVEVALGPAERVSREMVVEEDRERGSRDGVAGAVADK